MKTASIAHLNKNFSFQNGSHSLCFKIGKGDIPVIEIQNEQASATISLQGAHLFSWVPSGEDEVIWVSEDATFAPAKSVRGGVPICWPWFGAHENNTSYPAHGFARAVLWQVTNTQQLSAGETQITFKLETNQLDASQLTENIQHMWPTATIAEYSLTIAKTLTLELTTINNSDQSITLGQALHTYFNIEDVTNTTVYGLEGKDYLDKTDNFNRKIQTGPVIIDSEVDRVYLQTPDDIIIDNKKRKIIIKKQGSLSTVVWNPWKNVAEKMGDLGKEGYLKMLCVESANAAEDTISISAGESHKLTVIYEVERV
ncbi:MAG: D-hexose-6-phosphate mutarotase [Gammaproteobacteria bacterium]|nr:D-hexose-6-phosphate mutarotase [Gammaproteobacteria bacterium]